MGLQDVAKDLHVDDGKVLAEKAALGDPENKYYALMVAEIYSNLNQPLKAAEILDRLTVDSEKNQQYNLDLASIYLQAGEFDKALIVLDRAEAYYGVREPFTLQKQRIYLRKNNLKAAIEEGEKLIETFPGNPNYVLSLVEILYNNARIDQALELVMGEIEKYPNQSELQMAAYTLLKDIPAASENSVQNTATRYGGSKAFLKALHLIGHTVQYRPVSLIAMNRQWARSTSLKVTGYVSETTPSTSSNAGSGAPGLKTASVTTGDKFLVQPAIMEDGTIILKFGISLTDLLGLFNVSAGSGDSLQTVQTPETSGTDDQGSIRLRPGEAMIITGLSRQVANQDQNKIAEPLPLILGGSQKRSYQREDFLIIVRATPL